MLRLVGTRLLEIMIFFIILSFISFLLIKLTPGDPVKSILRVDDIAVNTQQMEELRTELGFNQPILMQYWKWLTNFFQFDLGNSYITNEPVVDILFSRLPATLELTVASLLVMSCIAVPLGSLSALYKDSWIDQLSRPISLIGSAVPSFWLGLMFIDVFAVKLHIFPTMGREGFTSIILPSLTLGIAMASVYVRLIRSSLLETMGQDFIKAARSRGLSETRIFFAHAFRHSLTPVITVFGVSLGSLIGGIVVIEVLFTYPGIGKLVVSSITSRDYPIIQGYILFMAITIFVINTLVDLSYRYLNPEVRLKGEDKQA
ncbi:nickel ABC transporter permease [Niallia nealsonii]|uniref:Nickel import system permease protein NikB n=1 Tax=Niallia nealsonii TaxID=115979 RepID=A0A2N0YZW4_9BACI|nr:nickel ABC transporter permease [Niallia nealsonii]PKG22785.1 nickel ABC transporter permease subunit NikB [Niallia nealsonii]